ncbi:hypothetical protein [Pseudovibrio sp. Alg231-02]|uniref:hypothetical protein n=1 Tax=Pseudovibrio sp. Alg231-02 TaxID=1922223 RepID=UPI000D55ECCC|nr:hypothetical protein [Pseudovibrio sp. Alg231-02]
MTLSDTVMPVAKLLFEGEGKILSQDHLVTVESQVGALVIRFWASKGRIVVTASLRHDLGDCHYWRDLKPHATPDENVELRRTFAPGRFTTQTQQILTQITAISSRLHYPEPIKLWPKSQSTSEKNGKLPRQ